MRPPALAIDNLGKRYRIHHLSGPAARGGYVALRDVLGGALKAPFRALRKRRRESVAGEMEDFWALRGVSLEIGQGEVVGIIGRNGAGKSTLLKILSNITEPTEGWIGINGRVSSLLEVGTGFHPELTGRENIFLNGAILGMTRSEIRRKFDEIVAFAEVEKFLDLPAKRYSSGMYVRLAFAVAAHLEPEILIVDEVLAVGDAGFQQKCIGKMDQVAKAGRTVLFVSHNMLVIQNLCSRAYLLEKGELILEGEVDTVVAGYLASVAGPEKAAGGGTHLADVRQAGEGGIRFLSIVLHDARGSAMSALAFGEAVSAELTFSVKRALRDVIVGLGVHTHSGFPLFATHTDDYGELLQLKPGIHKLRAKLSPNYLKPGTYSISLGAIAGGVTECHVLDAATFRIEPVLATANARLDDRMGVFMIPMRWDPPEYVGSE